MYSFIIRRFMIMIPTVLLLSILCFVIIELPPGDYLTSYIMQLEAEGTQVAEAEIARMRQRYGLDLPFYLRYFRWITNFVQGDLGLSFHYNRPVSGILRERMPATLLVAMATMIFTYFAAIPIGLYSAVKQYTLSDYVITILGFLGLATPNFLLALVLMFIFYRYFGVSIGGLFSQEYKDAAWNFAKITDLFGHLWIPVIVVGTAGTAGLIRTVRALMLDELGQDYIKVARSKGLTEKTIILKHALRVVINPTLSTIGWRLPRIISGQAITAIVLNLPTMGPVLLQGLIAQDMYLSGSLLLIVSILTVIGTLISDMLLAWSDPRIRYE